MASTGEEHVAAPAPGDGAPAGLPARAWADALFAGWLPVIAVNAVFARRVHVKLGALQQLAHHLYDAGQVLGLALISWLAALVLWRLSPARRAVVAVVVAIGVTYALLALDLESFLERHEGSRVPWRAVFALVGAAGLTASYALGLWLGRGAARWAIAALGVALAVGNHLVLELSYPGAHFVLAWCAALLIGTALRHDVAKIRLPRVARGAIAALGAASLASYAIVPGQVVRSALLGSSGAIAAPFVTLAWAALEDHDAVAAKHDPTWFRPRDDLPPIAALRPRGVPPDPIVILITIDALRADLFDGSAAERKAVRHMRAMAHRSLSFTRAWSPAAYTMGSLRSLFLGVYYFQHGMKLRGADGKQRKLPYLPHMLSKKGVTTVNVKAVRALDTKGSVARGFKEQIVPEGKRVTSNEVVQALIERIDEGASGPTFMYSHILDPHSPYSLGSKGRGKRSDKERYLAEVAYVDKAIGRLREALRERGLDKRTYFVVSADHAEAFGEHGHKYHATTVYQEMIHVPLIIEGPGIRKRRVKTPVTLIDMAPTILSIFGFDTPAHFMGQSLVPFMRGESPELTRPLAVDGGRAIRAMLFEGRWKAIVDVRRGTEELYDLSSDPKEQVNLAEEPFARGYFATLRAFFDSAK